MMMQILNHITRQLVKLGLKWMTLVGWLGWGACVYGMNGLRIEPEQSNKSLFCFQKTTSSVSS